MTFERPWAVWALLAALPILLFHLRLRRRRTVEVSSLALWRFLDTTRTGRTGMRRLKDVLAMCLLLAALGALTAALAGPVTGVAAEPIRRLVLVVDASISMNAVADGETTRFEHAVRSAIDAAERLGPGDEVTVWVAGDRPHVALPPTAETAHVAEALGRIATTLGPSSLAQTLDDAERSVRLRDVGRTDLLVLTDEVGAAVLAARETVRASGPSTDLPWDELYGIVPSGEPWNAALDARADPQDPGRLVVTVRTTDGDPAPRRLVVLRGKQTMIEIDAVPGSDGDVEIPVELPPVVVADRLTLRLEPADGFPEDDLYVQELRPRPSLRIGLLAPSGSPSRFLVEALAALGEQIDRSGTVLLSGEPPATVLGGLDVLISEGPMPAAMPRDLPYLRFASGTEGVRRPLLWGVGTHAVLNGVDLAPLRIDRATVVPTEGGDVALIASAAGIVGAARDRAGRRSVVVGFAPNASTLPLEAAFPILVRNALLWLARPAVLPPSVRSGSPLVLSEPLAPGVERVASLGPGKLSRDLPVTDDGSIPVAVPRPAPGAERAFRLLGLARPATTVVHWTSPPGFHTHVPAAERPDYPSAPDAVSALPDRRENLDTRKRRMSGFALLGVGLLLLGAWLLRVQ